MRTLRAYAQAITEAIGDGLASALRHVIGWLLMGAKAVLTMANAFRAFMQTLFGKNISGASLNLTDDLGESSDYAQDLDDGATGAADSLGDASDSAQQLKKDLSVLPFDELNQLNKDRESTGSSSGSPSGGVGGIGGIGDITDGLFDLTTDAFRDSTLPDVINEWAQRIRDAFESQDWVRLGQEIASGINDGVHALYEILDPEKVKEKVDPFIDAFTTTFNSFIDALDFEGIGKLLGRGLNDLLYIINSTLEKINWINLGKQLGRGLNGLVTELDFAAVGRLFANRINVIWETAWGFVTTFNWAELGENLATGAWEFVSHIDYDAIIGTFNEGLGGLADTVFTFASNFPWAETGTLWAQKANLLISGFPAEKIGSALATALNGITELFDNLLDPAKGGIDFYNIGSKLAEGANSLFEKPNGIDFERLGRVLANGLNILPRAVAGFVENFGWSEFGTTLSNGAWEFIESIDFDALQRAVNGGLRGIATTVTDFASHFPWQEAGTLIAGHVNDFIDNFPAEQIGTAVGTLLDGIVDSVVALTDPETGINFASLGKKLATGLTQMVITGIQPNAIGALITNLWSAAWTLLGNFIEGLRNEDGSGTSIGSTIKDTLEYIIENIDFGASNKALSAFVNNILEDIGNIFGDDQMWTGLGKKVGGGIADLLSGIHADDLGKAISSMASAFGEFITSAVGELWNRRKDIGAKFEELFKNIEWADVLSAVGLIVAPIMAEKIGLWLLETVVLEAVKSKFVELFTSSMATGLTEAAATSGVTTAAQGLGSAIGSAVVEAAGVVTAAAGITAAFVEIGEAAKSAFEILKGGNGFDTEGGAAIQSYIDKLRSLNDISRETGDQLFQLKESWESGEISDESFFTNFSTILQDGGISADQARGFLELLKNEVVLTDEQMEILNAAIAGMSTEASDAESVITTFGINSEDSGNRVAYAFARASDSMKQLHDDDMAKTLADAQVAFMNLTASGTDVQAAFQEVCSRFNLTEEAANTLKTALEIEFGEGAFEYLLGESQSTAESLGEVGTAASTASTSVGELGTEAEGAGTKIDTAFGDTTGLFSVFNGDVGAAIESMKTLGATPEQIKTAIDSYMGAGTYDNYIASAENAVTKSEAVSTAVSEIGTESETANTKTTSLSDIIGGFGGLLATFAMGAIKTAIEGIGTASETSEGQTDSFSESVKGISTEDAQKTLSSLEDSFTDVGDSSTEAKDEILTALSMTSSEMSTPIADIVSAVKTMGTDMESEAKTAGENTDAGIVSGITENAGTVEQTASDLAESILGKFRDGLRISSPSEATREIGQYVTQGLAEGITDEEQTLTDSISTLVSNFSSTASGLFTTLGDEFSGYGSDLVSAFSEGMSNAFANVSVYSYVTDIATDFASAISQNYYSLYYAGQSLGTAFANGVSSIHIPVPWLYVNYWDTYTNSDGSWYTVPRYGVNWYAKGGLFTSPTIAGFGEAGDEAALPLENKRVMSRIADAIIDNSGGMGMTSEQMSSAVARGMVQAMMSNQGNQNQVFNITVKTESDETLARAVIRGMDAIDYRENASPRFSY